MYSLEKHLCSFENEILKEKAQKYSFFKKRVKEVLQETKKFYPNYSLHDSSHSETIISNIEKLLGEDNISKMTFADTLFILFAAHLHDIGMVITYKQIESIINNPNFLKENRAIFSKSELIRELEYLEENNKQMENIKFINGEMFRKVIAEFNRQEHGKASAKFLKENLKEFDIDLSINHNGLLEHLGEICKSHQAYSQEETLKKLELKVNAMGNLLHPRFLAFLLRVGDLLDLDCDRFSKDMQIINGPLKGISKAHYLKHLSIKKVLIDKKNINIKAELEDLEALQPLREWKKFLIEEIEFINNNISKIIPEKIELIFPKPQFIISREDSEEEYKNRDLDIKFPETKVYDFIKGESIYKDKMVFLREIYQNALDSLKIRYWLDKKEEHLSASIDESYDEGKLVEEIIADYYGGKILKNYRIDFICYDTEIPEQLEQLERLYNDEKFSRVKREFYGKIVCVLRDNGIGISKNAFENRILEAGKHVNKNDEIKKIIDEMPNFLKPTSSFGLGMHSIFTITDTLIIKTKSLYEDDEGRNIIIKDIPNIGRVIGEEKRKNKQKKEIQGTTIFIPIKKQQIEYLHNEFEDNWIMGRKFALEESYRCHSDDIIGLLEVAFDEYRKKDILKFEIKNNYYDKENANFCIEKIESYEDLLCEADKEQYIVKFRKVKNRVEFTCIDKKNGHSIIIKLNGEKSYTKIYHKDIYVCKCERSDQRSTSYIDRFCEMGSVDINFSFINASDYIPASRDSIKSDKIEECILISENLMYQFLLKIKVLFSSEEMLKKILSKDETIKKIDTYWDYRTIIEEKLKLDECKTIEKLITIPKEVNIIKNGIKVTEAENNFFAIAFLDIIEEGLEKSPHFKYLKSIETEEIFRDCINKIKKEVLGNLSKEKIDIKTSIDTVMLAKLLLKFGLISDNDKIILKNLKRMYGVKKREDVRGRELIKNIRADGIKFFYYEHFIFEDIYFLSVERVRHYGVKTVDYMPIESLIEKNNRVYIKYFDNNNVNNSKLITTQLDSDKAIISLIDHQNVYIEKNIAIPAIEAYKELAVEKLPLTFEKFHIKKGNFSIIVPDIKELNKLLKDKNNQIFPFELLYTEEIKNLKEVLKNLIKDDKNLNINILEIYLSFKNLDVSKETFDKYFDEKELNIEIGQLNKYINYIHLNQIKIEDKVYSKKEIERKYKELIISLVYFYIYTVFKKKILKNKKESFSILKKCNYILLEKYLSERKEKNLELSYRELSEIMKGSLPKRAYKDKKWIEETLAKKCIKEGYEISGELKKRILLKRIKN